MAGREFFESIGKQLTKTADKVAKRTDEFISIQKVKSHISSLENQIDDDFSAIGEIIYGNYVAGEEYDADVTDICLEVTMLRKEIVELRDELNAMKGVYVCPGCGAEITADAKFCSECGEKQPERPDPSEEEEDFEEADDDFEEVAEEPAEEEAPAEEAPAEEAPAEETDQKEE